MIAGGSVAAVGAAIGMLAIARQFFEPFGFDRPLSDANINNFLLLAVAAGIVKAGAWIAGKTDEWF